VSNFSILNHPCYRFAVFVSQKTTLISDLLQLKGNFVWSQNNSKSCDCRTRLTICNMTAILLIKAETHDATNRCDTSPRQVAATNRRVWQVKIIVAATEFCRCDRILSLRSVARIQTGLNSCDVSQRQNKRKQLCRSVCTHLRQIAARKFKSTNEGTSISFPSALISFWSCFVSYQHECSLLMAVCCSCCHFSKFSLHDKYLQKN